MATPFSVLWVCSALITLSGFVIPTVLKYEMLVVVLGTKKCDLSQVKWAPQVALQWLPDRDVIPAYLMAAHHPVSAAWGVNDEELKDVVSLLDIGDVPDPHSLKASGPGMGSQRDQGCGRKPDRCLVVPAWQPREETCSQPIRGSDRSDLLL